jgi:hypothetical protein
MKRHLFSSLLLACTAILLVGCGPQQADSYYESIAPARLLKLQSAIALVQVELNLDLHPNPMADDAYFAKIEPDVQALHLAAKDAADLQKDTEKATGSTSAKYAGLDSMLGQIATLADELVNNFEHPRDSSKVAYQKVLKSLNQLTDAFESASGAYTAAGGPGIPTHEPPIASTTISTSLP